MSRGDAGSHRRLEDIARCLNVDLIAASCGLHHDERKVHNNIDTRDQVRRPRPYENVPLAVLGLMPAGARLGQRPPRHRQHTPDLGRELQSTNERLSDLPRRARDSDRKPGSPRVAHR